ncbi:hypothetical protein [Streptomyces sp. NPDC088785]|uniref:hypothetical protein n=1 Tax=Streptomyces sp. NPDC088785 TaxID=3365897 RepID=UPI003829EC13
MNRALLPLRTTLVFLIAILAGVVAASLTWASGEQLARSVMAGMGATAVAVPFFDRLIATDPAPGIDAAASGEADDRG